MNNIEITAEQCRSIFLRFVAPENFKVVVLLGDGEVPRLEEDAVRVRETLRALGCALKEWRIRRRKTRPVMDPDEIKYLPTKYLPTKDIKFEEGAEELLHSPLMRPYIEAAKALLQNEDASEAIADIAALPLEKRYVWRVASALKWGFADFDSGSVALDRETMSPEDRKKVAESLAVRPIQFCIFLKAVLGAEEMQRIMVHAIKSAKQVP